MLLLCAPAAAHALPRGWPAGLQIGLASQPGQAAAQRAEAPFRFRYQYLAGGVNTGSGWSTWNENGTFVSRYVAESRAVRAVPVLTYYMLLQSSPAAGGSEAERDLSNLRNPATMAAYYRDLRLALRRARGRRLVVLHVEPDLWGYIQQAARRNRAASVPAAVASSGDRALRGLPEQRGRLRPRDRAAAQPAGPERGAGLAPERVGHRRGSDLLRPAAGPHRRAGPPLGALLPLAAGALRRGVQRRGGPRRGLQPRDQRRRRRLALGRAATSTATRPTSAASAAA